MDEPTIGLDPAGALELRRLIPRLVESGKTILLTTHYMSEADELCGQISIINQGRIVAAGTPSEIKRKFSRIAVLEVICRLKETELVNRLSTIAGISSVAAIVDGPLHRLTLHMEPGTGTSVAPEVKALLGENSIESVMQRDPTLEEAYLSIIR
jgi:ABC-2 type transport system ATP-binding protein